MIRNAVGNAIDQLGRRHRPDMLLLLITGVLLLLGLVIIYAISPALVARSGGDLDQNHFMYRQVLYLLLGIGAFAITAFVPLTFWKKTQGKLLIAALILGMLPFVLQSTPIGLCTNDACRWLTLGGVSFQPAEFMKFALVLFLAGFLAVRIQQGKLNDLHQTIIPAVVILVTMAVIVIGLQRDLGTGLSFFAIVMTMLFVAGVHRKILFVVLAASFGLGVLFTVMAPHRVERVLTFFNHSSVQSDQTGYHINQALIAVGSGGLTGKGLGQSIQAFGYLPEAANDSIFAILAEKFGFIGTVGVLVIFTALFVRIIRIMEHSTSLYFRLLVAGIFGWIFTHAAVNIGAMLGIFPLTGITLPFVSFGGTSLLFMLCAMGIVFQISQYTSHKAYDHDIEKGETHDNRRSGRGLGWPRNTGTSRST